MSNPLVPEQRPDKNGVIVTRHVRAGGKPSKSKHPLPLPTPILGSLNASIVDAQMSKLKAFLDSNDVGFFARRKLMKTLKPDALSTLAKHGIGEGEHTLPMSLMNHCVNSKSFSLINDLAAYVDDHGTFSGGFYGEYSPAVYLLGVAKNSRDNGTTPVSYSEAGAEERIRQHAVIESARSLRVDCIVETSGSGNTEYGFPNKRINHPALVDYIRKYPHKAEKVVHLVNERGSETIGSGGRTLDGLVDNFLATATPLSGGAL
jgi:hypothetical protein